MLRSFTRALDVTGHFPGSDVSKLAMRPLSFSQKPDLASIQSVSDSGGLEQEPEEPEPVSVAEPLAWEVAAQASGPHQPAATGSSPSTNGFHRIPGKGPTVPLPAIPSASELPIPPPRRPPPVYRGARPAPRRNGLTRKRPDLPDLNSWCENRDSFLNMETEIEHSSRPRASERTLLNSVSYDESFPIASSSHSITEVASGSTRMVSQLPDILSTIRPAEAPSSDFSDMSGSLRADSERSGNQNFVRQLWSFIKIGSKSQTPSRLGTPKSSTASIQAPSINSAVSSPPSQDASGSGQDFIDYPEETYRYNRRERTYSYYVTEPSAKVRPIPSNYHIRPLLKPIRKDQCIPFCRSHSPHGCAAVPGGTGTMVMNVTNSIDMEAEDAGTISLALASISPSNI